MKNRRAGFTLAEVLIALAIFGLTATMLLQIVANVQTAIIDMRDESARAEAKRFVLRRVMAATTIEAVQTGGSVTLDGGDNVNWTAQLEQTDLPDLHQVALTFNWGDGTAETMTLSAFRPEWSDATQRSAKLSEFKTQHPSDRF